MANREGGPSIAVKPGMSLAAFWAASSPAPVSRRIGIRPVPSLPILSMVSLSGFLACPAPRKSCSRVRSSVLAGCAEWPAARLVIASDFKV